MSEIKWPLLRSWKPHELLYAFELYTLGVDWTIIFSLYQILVMDPIVDDVFKLNYRFVNKISNLSSNFILARLCLSFTAVQISNHIFFLSSVYFTSDTFFLEWNYMMKYFRKLMKQSRIVNKWSPTLEK